MVGKKNSEKTALENKVNKPTPMFLKDDFPYTADGKEITDIDTIKTAEFYEIKCPACKMSIRLQGRNLRSKYDIMNKSGCVSCGNKKITINKVNMSSAQKNTN